MSTRTREPFEYKNKKEFQTKLVDWVGDVLYDILPEHGYEVRDEQIYTAFQIADAVCSQKVHLAEAGLGTGKTFAYLLSAIPYARFSKKPVVIACASTALQEQLAGEQGDIKVLSKLLDLEVDARMAKDPHQYICDLKVEENVGELGEVWSDIEQWINQTKRGERSELPTIPDGVWKKIAWDDSMPCETCTNRGYCKLVKAKEYYRPTKDLLIVDHETFFHDLWTRDEYLTEGKLPILPNYAAVIFDEGHKIMLPAAMQAGNQLNQEEIQTMIATLEEIQGARSSLEAMTQELVIESEEFFDALNQSIVLAESAQRLSIRRNATLFGAATKFYKTLDHLLLELQIEQGLYIESLTPTQMQAFEGQVERAMLLLNRFCRNKGNDVITWIDKRDGSFWVVPRNLSELLNKYLFQKGLPVVFTSATLSQAGNFEYFIRTFGLLESSKSSIGSPFDIENQVVVHFPRVAKVSEGTYTSRIETLVSLLEKNGGRALILTNSIEEVKKIRKKLKGHEFPFEILWEDKADRGYLLRKFKEEETSVLVGTNFWEGIDVPGDALNLLMIWQLPFPDLDPMLEARRKEAQTQGLDPVITVDYPEMSLKLKQGCGRLIRTEEDKGEIVFLDSVIGTKWEKIVMEALPMGASVEY